MRDNIEGVVFAVFVIIALLLLLIATPSHGAVAKHHESSIGNVMYNENPLMYTVGSLATTQDAVAVVDGNLNIRIKPMGTYMLFDEAILFCGLPVEKFKGITEPFVLTYKRTASRIVQGIGCHMLVRVDSIKPKENVK